MSSSTDTNESQNRIATNPGPASPKQKPALFSPKKITPELAPKKGMNFDVAAGRAPYDDQYPISDYVKLSNNNYRSPHKGNRPNRNVSISSDNLKGQAAGGHAYIPRKFSSDNIHADDQQGGGNRPYRTNSGNSPRGNNNNNNNNNNNLNFGKGNNNNYQRNNQRNNQRNQQNNNTNNNNNNNGPGHNKQKPTRSVSGGFAKFAPGSRSQDLQNPSQDIHDFKPNPKKNVE